MYFPWLAWKHFDIWLRTDLKFKFSSSSLVLHINILVSSANMLTSDWLLTGPEKSFMYILNNSGSKTEPWETPCLIILQLDESAILFISLIFYFLLPTKQIGPKPIQGHSSETIKWKRQLYQLLQIQWLG